MKRITGALFLLWTGAILLTYYVVQKPGLLNAFPGLVDTVWTLFIAALLLFNAYGIGQRVLRLFLLEKQEEVDHLLLSTGIGLGALGLLGLLFSVVQLANHFLLTIIQIALTVFFILRNDLTTLRRDLVSLSSNLRLSFSHTGPLTRLALLAIPILTFLLTLVPPFEAFDALLYHLTLPQNILQLGGLQPINNAPFWFPSLTENVYLWALAGGSERATQIIHFAWALIAALLIWHWTFKTWDAEIARKALLLLAAMPSLPTLASIAYADMALVYYAIAALYALTKYRTLQSPTWISIAGLMAGFAMGIKYTSFVVPLACGLLLLLNDPLRKAIQSAAKFSFIALVTALPWYIRNAIFMGNPFYPFLFGGRYWDDFLASWYADAGTGIGWDVLQILLTPFYTLLGTRDVTFFNARMGPLLLILAPFTIWILISRTRPASARGWSLLAISVFSLLSFGAWLVGVINSASLWQARLLFPVLVPFSIPSALAWDSLKQFDTSKLRIHFIINTLIAAVIALSIIDTAIFVVRRNPLAVAFGAQSREQYIQRINPSYAALMDLMDELPAGARVYSLFEPRSYDLPRSTQPDPILYNFAYDAHRYKTPAAIIQSWKSQQYTHVIVYERGLSFMSATASSKITPSVENILQETLEQLILLARTPDKVYTVYKIP